VVAHLSETVDPNHLIPPSESGFDVVRDTARPHEGRFSIYVGLRGRIQLEPFVLVRLPCVLDQASNTFERKPTAVGAGRPHIDRLWRVRVPCLRLSQKVGHLRCGLRYVFM